MAEDLRKGDKVRWRSHGGEAVGEVEKKSELADDDSRICARSSAT